MSDARTDFFSSSSTAKKAAQVASRDDFFSGKYSPPDEAPAADYSKPYAYFTPEVQRDVGNTGQASQLIEPAMQTGSSLASSAAGGVAGTLDALWNVSPAGRIAHHFGMPEVPAAAVVEEIQGSGTYQPRSAGGQEVSEALASGYNPLTWPGRAGDFLGDTAAEHGAPPELSAFLKTAPDAAVAALGIKAAPKVPELLKRAEKPVVSAQELLDKHASSQSMGAAGAAVDLQRLSPDLRVAVEKAVQKTGGAVNADAMARHIQADSLPVKVHLSEGQVLADPRLISEERNARGATKGFVEGFAAQNKALTANLRAFRDTTGENVFSTNQVEHADTLIKRYNDIDDARNADIGAKYKALRDAAGGKFPVDAKSLLADATSSLHEKLLFEDAPASVMKNLERLADTNSMTFEQFEHLRTNLARIQRSHTDNGNVRAAAGIIRDAMERLPLAEGAGNLKPLADSARAAARERFEALSEDPAYKAAVEGTTPPDKFVQKFVIAGARDNVAKLSEAMKGDETAAQTLKVATLDHLRQAAGVDASFNGNFTQAGYNKALRALEPKLGSLLDQKLVEHVQNLGDVARYSQQQPEGHYVNNSNTSVAQRALAHGADVLEGAANVKAGGVPVGTWVRQHVTDRQGRKAAANTFAPGAGLTRLSELQKLKEPK